MEFRKDAALTIKPTSINLAAATLAAPAAPLDAGDWAINLTQAATGNVIITSATGDALVATNNPIYTIQNITNPPINADNTGCSPNPTNSSAGTCYVRITTYNTDTVADMTSANDIDETTITFTITEQTTLTAKVDPSMRFTVTGVSNVAQTGNTHAIEQTSTFNTLPFGYLAVADPVYMAQDLEVITNANNGYDVTMTMRDDMSGQYAGNLIDPFDTAADDWTAPEVWTTPTGSAKNVDSGWIGAHSNDSTLPNWGAGADNKWAPVDGTADLVMTSAVPDNGGTDVRITFVLEVNQYQPADQYTGYMVYNATPKY